MTPELSFEALTPVSFLERSGEVFPDRPAVVDGDLSRASTGKIQKFVLREQHRR